MPSGLMQFNMYHHYTVDEHLIRAVGNVAAIERGEHQGRHPLSTDVIKRIKSRDVLYCAMLLHDMAKGLPGDHSDVGAAIADSLCPRLGLSADDTAAVAWLVKNHLVMSDTAQRRDVSDPKTVRDFVAMVQSPEMLRLLLVLTVADIRAVGPGRVERLEGPAAARALLRRRTRDDGRRHGAGRAARASRKPRRRWRARSPICRKQRASALCRAITTLIGWPSTPRTQERHARLMAEGRRQGRAAGARRQEQRFPRRHRDHRLYAGPSRPVRAVRRRHRGVRRLDRRRQGLHHLGRLRAGCLLGAGRGRRAVRRRGPHRTPAPDHREDRCAARSCRAALIAKRPPKHAPAPSRCPRVNFDNEASHIATVVEVRGLDRVGFLYDVTTGVVRIRACRSPRR